MSEHDKFTRPTNSYMREKHDERVAEGFQVVTCPYCNGRRWFTNQMVVEGAQMCDSCALDGVPGREPQRNQNYNSRGGLCARQREKKK